MDRLCGIAKDSITKSVVGHLLMHLPFLLLHRPASVRLPLFRRDHRKPEMLVHEALIVCDLDFGDSCCEDHEQKTDAKDLRRSEEIALKRILALNYASSTSPPPQGIQATTTICHESAAVVYRQSHGSSCSSTAAISKSPSSRGQSKTNPMRAK